MTIRGLGGVAIGVFPMLGTVTLHPPAGQEMHLVGLGFGCPVTVPGGRVSFDQCAIGPVYTGAVTLLHASNATVHLQDTTCTTGASATRSALSAVNATVTAVGCDFHSGGFAVDLPPAVDVVASRLEASDCDFAVSTAPGLYTVGLRARTGSRVWLGDCTVNSQAVASCGFESVASTVRVSRSVIGQSAGTCASPEPGVELLGVQRSEPLHPGGNFALRFKSEPNAFVFVFAGPVLGTLDFGPLLEQPSWLDHAYSFSTALLLADGNGDANVSWQLPNGPGLSNLTLWFEGISGLSLPLQASAVVGGVVR